MTRGAAPARPAPPHPARPERDAGRRHRLAPRAAFVHGARAMRSRLLALAAVGAALAATAAVARAHDTWLLALRAVVPPGAELLLDLTSGMRFPANETALKAERVAAARARLAGAVDTLPPPRAAARSLRFRAPLRRAGVATLWVDLAPRELALDSAEVVGYLREVGAPDSVRAAYLRPPPAGGARRWRERYVKHAKAVVRVASPQRPVPAADSSWREPAGQALELVPDVDPTALRAGDTLRVRLLGAGGAPVPFAAAGFVGAGARAAGALARTDAAGRVAFRVPAAGRWMVRATVLRRAASPDLDWESDFATLTGATR